jgi:fumarylpyruvate hydrolase
MADLVRLPDSPRLPVVDDDGAPCGDFPVGRVICVGRNYADHAREMGADPDREVPFFFLKPATSVRRGPDIVYPRRTSELHHEVELVLALGPDAVLACGVGLDLTRRDRQADMKAARRPWEAGKVFPGAALCGTLRAGTAVLERPASRIHLDVNGAMRQEGRIGEMIHGVATLLREAEALFGLEAGDLLFTGTPAGVGPLVPGDRLRAEVEGLPVLDALVVDALVVEKD